MIKIFNIFISGSFYKSRAIFLYNFDANKQKYRWNYLYIHILCYKGIE